MVDDNDCRWTDAVRVRFVATGNELRALLQQHLIAFLSQDDATGFRFPEEALPRLETMLDGVGELYNRRAHGMTDAEFYASFFATWFYLYDPVQGSYVYPFAGQNLFYGEGLKPKQKYQEALESVLSSYHLSIGEGSQGLAAWAGRGVIVADTLADARGSVVKEDLLLRNFAYWSLPVPGLLPDRDAPASPPDRSLMAYLSVVYPFPIRGTYAVPSWKSAELLFQHLVGRGFGQQVAAFSAPLMAHLHDFMLLDTQRRLIAHSESPAGDAEGTTLDPLIQVGKQFVRRLVGVGSHTHPTRRRPTLGLPDPVGYAQVHLIIPETPNCVDEPIEYNVVSVFAPHAAGPFLRRLLERELADHAAKPTAGFDPKALTEYLRRVCGADVPVQPTSPDTTTTFPEPLFFAHPSAQSTASTAADVARKCRAYFNANYGDICAAIRSRLATAEDTLFRWWSHPAESQSDDDQAWAQFNHEVRLDKVRLSVAHIVSQFVCDTITRDSTGSVLASEMLEDAIPSAIRGSVGFGNDLRSLQTSIRQRIPEGAILCAYATTRLPLGLTPNQLEGEGRRAKAASLVKVEGSLRTLGMIASHGQAIPPFGDGARRWRVVAFHRESSDQHGTETAAPLLSAWGIRRDAIPFNSSLISPVCDPVQWGPDSLPRYAYWISLVADHSRVVVALRTKPFDPKRLDELTVSPDEDELARELDADDGLTIMTVWDKLADSRFLLAWSLSHRLLTSEDQTLYLFDDDERRFVERLTKGPHLVAITRQHRAGSPSVLTLRQWLEPSPGVSACLSKAGCDSTCTSPEACPSRTAVTRILSRLNLLDKEHCYFHMLRVFQIPTSGNEDLEAARTQGLLILSIGLPWYINPLLDQHAPVAAGGVHEVALRTIQGFVESQMAEALYLVLRYEIEPRHKHTRHDDAPLLELLEIAEAFADESSSPKELQGFVARVRHCLRQACGSHVIVIAVGDSPTDLKRRIGAADSPLRNQHGIRLDVEIADDPGSLHARLSAVTSARTLDNQLTVLVTKPDSIAKREPVSHDASVAWKAGLDHVFGYMSTLAPGIRGNTPGGGYLAALVPNTGHGVGGGPMCALVTDTPSAAQGFYRAHGPIRELPSRGPEQIAEWLAEVFRSTQRYVPKEGRELNVDLLRGPLAVVTHSYTPGAFEIATECKPIRKQGHSNQDWTARVNATIKQPCAHSALVNHTILPEIRELKPSKTVRGMTLPVDHVLRVLREHFFRTVDQHTDIQAGVSRHVGDILVECTGTLPTWFHVDGERTKVDFEKAFVPWSAIGQVLRGCMKHLKPRGLRFGVGGVEISDLEGISIVTIEPIGASDWIRSVSKLRSAVSHDTGDFRELSRFANTFLACRFQNQQPDDDLYEIDQLRDSLVLQRRGHSITHHGATLRVDVPEIKRLAYILLIPTVRQL